jgi:hypothetical protein
MSATRRGGVYVNRWGLRGSPQPFTCDGLISHQFVVQGRLSSLQGLCDRYLNRPSQGELCYRPVTQNVMVMFNYARSIRCVDRAYQHMGFSPETEVAFMVLTVAVREVDGRTVADHLAWFVPYIFVDNPAALTWGREIHGFPKELGWIELPVDPQAADRLTLDCFGLRRFHPTERMCRRRLLEIERIPEGAAGQPDRAISNSARWTSPTGALRAARDALLGPGRPTLPGMSFSRSLFSSVTSWDVPMVFLKQMYDAEDGDRASFQAIVEAGMRVSAFRGWGLIPGQFRLNLEPMESHPIEEDLGLEPRQPVQLAYWVEFDAVLSAGRTVWSSP